MKKNWINTYEKENINSEIQKLTKNIEKSYVEIGKILKNSNNNNEDLKKYEIYGISKNQAEQLIANIDFIEKYNINTEGISLSKILILSKVKYDKNMKLYIEEAKKLNTEELKNLIYKNDKSKKINKTFIFDEEMEELYKSSYEIVKKITNSNKINKTEVMKCILQEFYSSYSSVLNEKETK